MFADTFDQGSADLFEIKNEAANASAGFENNSNSSCDLW
jgi:hypothetical protein